MKTQIKRWGDSNVVVLSSDFMKYHEAEVGDWINLDDCTILGKTNSKKQQLENLKENFPSAYEFHIKQNPVDAI